MERVSSTNTKPFQLNARQLAKRFAGLYLTPGSQQPIEPVPGRIICSWANGRVLSQSLESAPDLDARSPPDNNCVLA